MSTHCSKYPGCGCGPEVGTNCYPSFGEMIKDKSEFHSDVTDLMAVLKNDDRQQNINYSISKRGTRKTRSKPTNYTAPKKKRKK